MAAAAARAALVVELDAALVDELGGAPGGARARHALDDWASALSAAMGERLAGRLGVAVPRLTVRPRRGPGRGYELFASGVSLAREDCAASDARAWLDERIPATIERYAFEFVDVEAVSRALDRAAEERPALVREVVPRIIDVVRLSALLRQLVRERVPVPGVAALLDAVAEVAPGGAATLDPAVLVERVRRALGRAISARYAPGGKLASWRLDPFIEDTVRGALARDEGGAYLALEPEIAHEIAVAIGRATRDHEAEESATGAPPVVLVAADVRRFVAQLIEVEAPDVAVLSPAELAPEVRVRTASVITV